MTRPLDAVPVPAGLLHPVGLWVFNYVIPAATILILIVAGRGCVRQRRLTWLFLFVVCSMSTFWMETIGDWGQHLRYSPRFSSYSWDWLPYHTPTDPYFMPFAYGVYWTLHAAAVMALGAWLAKKRGWTLLRAVLVLSIPVNFIFDLSLESTAAYLGWWTYDPGFGPIWHFARGSQPLLWPVTLMIGWPNFVAYVAGKPASTGPNVIERTFRLDAAASGPAHELKRFGAWLLTFQVTFFLMLVVPLVVLRLVTGHDSPYVP